VEGATENAAVVQGPARRPGRARARPGGAAAAHRRRGGGAFEGDPPHVRLGHADPAAPAPQGLPKELRRSLACTNIVENIVGSVRRVCRNVKRWRDASMALRWTVAAKLEAAKGFRWLKPRGQLPLLRATLQATDHEPHELLTVTISTHVE
jgi:hypothetical protein